jgi:NAD(P)-dependent dehydrogenase (short-subunit alcohol dehydrogenase family)
MPRQDGRVAVVTGGNTGLGFATARGLARAGAVVVLACRSEQRGQEAEAAINAELAGNASAASGRAEFMLLDVGDLASVRSFADAFGQRYERLDVLVLNAVLRRSTTASPRTASSSSSASTTSGTLRSRLYSSRSCAAGRRTAPRSRRAS